MKKPEYIPYGPEWRKKMARLKKADVIRIASDVLRQVKSERREHLELIEAISKCGSPQTMNVLIEKAQQALRNAGETEDL